jgi:ribosomal protein S18 acetylase RimI-like enzyme
MPARTPKPPPDPSALRRVGAGRHATGDGRFVVDQASGGWMLIDAEQLNELGLPLVRGPFATLELAKAALESARTGPAPVSDLAEKIARLPPRTSGPAAGARSRPTSAPASPPEPPPPPPPPVVVREYRTADGDALRALWTAAGLNVHDDDDPGLRVFAQRNPGLFLIASQGTAVVGSVMGAWDGRRGWLYHVATATTHRRTGLGSRLVREVETRLDALGCRKVNVVVLDGNEDAVAFWTALGYDTIDAHQYGRRLAE